MRLTIPQPLTEPDRRVLADEAWAAIVVAEGAVAVVIAILEGLDLGERAKSAALTASDATPERERVQGEVERFDEQGQTVLVRAVSETVDAIDAARDFLYGEILVR